VLCQSADSISSDKKLEKELKVSIFERRKSSVHPTDLGNKIIAQAKITLAEANVIKELASADKDQLNSALKVGAINTIGPYLFPQMVYKMRAIAPKMPLYIEENYTKKLRQKLIDGDLDAIIVALPFDEVDLVTSPLYREDFFMLLHPEHPWCSKQTIPTAALADTKLLLLGEGHCFREQILESCLSLQQVSKQQNRSTEGSSLETIRMMVASGLGSSVVPHSAAQLGRANDDLKTLPFSEPVPFRTVALVWRASFSRVNAIHTLLEALNAVQAEMKINAS
jgi:LysR family hydrogen peroxide-inducible transcriptional activator